MTAAGEGGNLDRDQVSDTIVCHVSVGLGLGSSGQYGFLLYHVCMHCMQITTS